MTIGTFAKKLGFKNGHAYGFKGHLHTLERIGAVQVKQAGYYADSMNHPKVVIIKNLQTIQSHFKTPGLLEKVDMPPWHRKPKCHHRDFMRTCTFDERFINGKVFRKVILQCGHCDFTLQGLEVDGVMKQAREW